MTQNHVVRPKSRPRGLAARENFTAAKEPVPPLKDGKICPLTPPTPGCLQFSGWTR